MNAQDERVWWDHFEESRKRRELERLRVQRLRRLRLVLLIPALTGGLVGLYEITRDDPTDWLVLVAMMLVVPYLATFQWLGPANHYPEEEK